MSAVCYNNSNEYGLGAHRTVRTFQRTLFYTADSVIRVILCRVGRFLIVFREILRFSLEIIKKSETVYFLHEPMSF